jgi:hypothetical protein
MALVSKPKGMIWKVREKCDSTILGELKVYLFQKRPGPFFEKWRKGLNTKITEYNQSQYNNIGQPQVLTPEYTIDPSNHIGNYNYFLFLLEKFSRETRNNFCGTQMNPRYLHSSIEENNICMFVTSIKNGTTDEILHSVCMFNSNNFDNPNLIGDINIDVLCSCTIDNYIKFKGGYRIMALLYGICRNIFFFPTITLNSLSKAEDFYKSWGFTQTGRVDKNGLPELESECQRPRSTTKNAVQRVIEMNRNQQTTGPSLFAMSRASATPTAMPKAFAAAATAAPDEEVIYLEDKNNYYFLSSKNADGTKNIYTIDENGNMKVKLNVDPRMVATREEYIQQIGQQKAAAATAYQAAPKPEWATMKMDMDTNTSVFNSLARAESYLNRGGPQGDPRGGPQGGPQGDPRGDPRGGPRGGSKKRKLNRRKSKKGKSNKRKSKKNKTSN